MQSRSASERNPCAIPGGRHRFPFDSAKIKAWRTPERRPSTVIKDLGDIARLIEAHPELQASLPADVIHAISR